MIMTKTLQFIHTICNVTVKRPEYNDIIV